MLKSRINSDKQLQNLLQQFQNVFFRIQSEYTVIYFQSLGIRNLEKKNFPFQTLVFKFNIIINIDG